MAYPKIPSKKGCDGWIHDPDDSWYHFVVKDEILVKRSDLKSQVYRLQLLQFDDGYEQFRLGYDIIGKKPRMRGKWVWGQYCPFIPKREFKKIISEAIRLHWISLPKSLLKFSRR